MADRYADPADPLNGPEYHTGKPCIERGCTNPAGTAWSPFWCQPCNVKRMDRISASLERVLYEPDGAAPTQKLVPIEPTQDMLYAMAECDGYQRGDRDHPMLTRWEDYWRMAISAAPPGVFVPHGSSTKSVDDQKPANVSYNAAGVAAPAAPACDEPQP